MRGERIKLLKGLKEGNCSVTKLFKIFVKKYSRQSRSQHHAFPS